MAPQIQLYTETMDRHFRWHIDEREPAPDMPVVDSLVAQMPNYFPVPLEYSHDLAGMLCMGMGRSYPFSFAQRRIPSVMSEKLMEIYLDDTRAFNASWITRRDLVLKATELLVTPDKDGLKCRPILTDLINSIPEYTGDAKHQRIVFWFRN